MKILLSKNDACRTDWASGSPDWDDVKGEELYTHFGDDGDETNVDSYEH